MTWGGDHRRNKKGLHVGHTCGLVKPPKNGRRYERQPDGWHVYVWINNTRNKGYRPILGLRFIRQKDAERAAQALTAAGYDTYDKLRVADAMTVKAIACEHLQW